MPVLEPPSLTSSQIHQGKSLRRYINCACPQKQIGLAYFTLNDEAHWGDNFIYYEEQGNDLLYPIHSFALFPQKKMMYLFIYYFVLILTFSPLSYAQRHCAMDLDFLWKDWSWNPQRFLLGQLTFRRPTHQRFTDLMEAKFKQAWPIKHTAFWIADCI